MLRQFFRIFLPKRAFDAIRAGTREWLIECPCGYRRDLWDVGGIRYKAAGEPRRLLRCPSCGQVTWHKIRRKTEEEKKTV
jgi:uncharacterized Zn finger protein